MEENNKPEGGNKLPEAPASATMKIKSPNGFEYLFTMRDESSKNLLFKMKTMEQHFIDNNFTPVPQNGYQRTTVTTRQTAPAQTQPSQPNEYNTTCEVCGKPATERRGVTRGGKAYHGIFCSTDERSHTRWLWN